MTLVNTGKTYSELGIGPQSELIDWANSCDKGNKQRVKLLNQGSWNELFKNKYRNVTLIMCFNWFTYTFIYYGITIYLPTILDLRNK